MTTIDPQRRRLTVAPGQGGQMVAGAGAEYSGKAPDMIAYLNGAHAAGLKAISYSSKTDAVKKNSFDEKDVEIVVADGADQDACTKWLLSDLGMAVHCKKGCKPEAPNQDSYSILAVEGKYVLMGVYDGHGPFGHDVSEFVRVELPKLLLSRDVTTNPEKAFMECFVECQAMIEAERRMDSSRSGATTTMALWNFETASVTVAHVGDSRCVVGRTAASDPRKYSTEDITVDHKPNLPAEKARIESSKPPGRVVFDGFYNYRVFAQGGMYPGLNMSRALGDVVAHKEAGLSAEPDVKTFSTEKPDGGVLTLCMSTDGVWEFIESADAFERIKAPGAGPCLQDCVAKLTKDSYDAWMKDSDGEISDDITAICVHI